jgi:hypothetical protein
VQNEFDVELGRVRHRSRHPVSPSTKLRVQNRITCHLRPDVSTDTASQLLMMGDRLPVAVATHAPATQRLLILTPPGRPTMRLLVQVDIVNRS